MKLQKFKLFNQDIIINYLEHNHSNNLGSGVACLNIIDLQLDFKGNPIPESSIVNTFYHEVIHIMLDNLGYGKLSEDEVFVQNMANAFQSFNSNFDIKL